MHHHNWCSGELSDTKTWPSLKGGHGFVSAWFSFDSDLESVLVKSLFYLYF